MNRRGVALLTVLWILAALGTVAALGARGVRLGAATAELRVTVVRERWHAEGCLALWRAAMDRALSDGRAQPWQEPARLAPTGCPVSVATPPDGPVYLQNATAEQLATLPGFTPEVIRAVLAERAWGTEIRGVGELVDALPPTLRDEVVAGSADLTGQLVFEPPAWDVTVRGTAATVRERWTRAGTTVLVVQRELR